jgi:putative transcriptional regulator
LISAALGGYAMTTKTKTASRILEVVHETARDLHTAGFIDMRRMREYDSLCLAPIPAYSSHKIRTLRKRYKLSQAVLMACEPVASAATRGTQTDAAGNG